MKKRKVKDFIALYAPEDEEKLVLIQDVYVIFFTLINKMKRKCSVTVKKEMSFLF